MINAEEKLAMLRESILSETKQKADKLVSDAENESSRIVLEASDKYYADAEKTIESEQTAIAAKYAKQTAALRSQVQKDILMHRNMLTQKLFDGVREKLKEFCNTKEYKEYISRCISEYKKSYDIENAEVRVSAADMQRTELFEGLPKSVKVTCDDTIALGGVKIKPANVGVICDGTLDAALIKQAENFSDIADSSLKV